MRIPSLARRIPYAIVVALLFIGHAAHAQIRSGTVVFVDFAQDQITIAADSRTTYDGGTYSDKECKISAFGDRFIFTMAGTSSKVGVWNAHEIAREAWEAEATNDQDALGMVISVAQKWIQEIQEPYGKEEIIDGAERHNPDGEPVLANAGFAAVDMSGRMAVAAVSILYNRELYLTTRRIQFNVNARILAPPNWFAGGYTNIIEEFMGGETERAKSYMDNLRTQISDRSDSEQRASIAGKLVEWSVQLQPDNAELGLPVDVVQLDSSGVHWIQRKDNCAEN